MKSDRYRADKNESLLLKSAGLEIRGNSSLNSHAVLCTDDRTFHIRQVNSSNTIYILQPSQIESSNGETSISEDAISAIAQPTAILELIPSSSNGESILRQILPVYDAENELGPSSVTPAADRITKDTILDNVPLSFTEFEVSWIQLCAFEHEGSAWLPVPSLLCQVWKSIMSAATASSVDLSHIFPTEDIERLVTEDGYPVRLTRAILRRVQSRKEDPMDGCKRILVQSQDDVITKLEI